MLKSVPFLLIYPAALILSSCSEGMEVERRRVGENEEIGTSVSNRVVPNLEQVRTDSGVHVKWDWMDYQLQVHSVDFFVPQADIDKGEYNRLYEIRALPLSPGELDYGSLIRSGGTGFIDELAAKLLKIGSDKGYDLRRQADIAVTMVQNIPYTLVHQMSHAEILELAKKNKIDFLISYHNDPHNSPYNRSGYGGCQDSVNPAGVYAPSEFISSMRGDCDTRTLFLYTLMKKMGFDVAILNGPGHSMLGSPLRPENPTAPYVEDNGKRYYFWETTIFYNQNNVTGPRLGDVMDAKFNSKEWKIMIK